jgi:hypothetical protein
MLSLSGNIFGISRMGVLALAVEVDRGLAVLDSGANANLTSDRTLFIGDLTEVDVPVLGVDPGSGLKATGHGSGAFVMENGVVVPLTNLFFVPGVRLLAPRERVWCRFSAAC